MKHIFYLFLNFNYDMVYNIQLKLSLSKGFYLNNYIINKNNII